MHRLRLSSLGAFVSRASLRTNRLSHEMKNRTTRKLITGPEVVMCTVTVDGRFCHSLDPTLLGLRASGLQVSRSRPHVPGFNSAARGGRLNLLNVSTTTHCYPWNCCQPTGRYCVNYCRE